MPKPAFSIGVSSSETGVVLNPENGSQVMPSVTGIMYVYDLTEESDPVTITLDALPGNAYDIITIKAIGSSETKKVRLNLPDGLDGNMTAGRYVEIDTGNDTITLQRSPANDQYLVKHSHLQRIEQNGSLDSSTPTTVTSVTNINDPSTWNIGADVEIVTDPVGNMVGIGVNGVAYPLISRQYVQYEFPVCPMNYPFCLMLGRLGGMANNAADIQALLDSKYGAGSLTFNEVDCCIYGFISADEKFELSMPVDLAEVRFSVASETAITGMVIDTEDGSDISIDWGDGTVETNLSTPYIGGHTYGTAYTGDIVITLSSACACVTTFEMNLNHADFNIETFFAQIAMRCVTRFRVQGANTISGNLAVAFQSVPLLGYFRLLGQNMTTGNLAIAFSATPALFYYTNTGFNTTSGDLAVALCAVPTMTLYSNQGQNATSGDLALALCCTPLMDNFTNTGLNTTTGDIAVAFGCTPNMVNFANQGSNTMFGDLAVAFVSTPNLSTFGLQGANRSTGDIAVAFAGVSSLTSYINLGQNTTFGNMEIALCATPGLLTFSTQGLNELSGDLAIALCCVPSLTTYNHSAPIVPTTVGSSIAPCLGGSLRQFASLAGYPAAEVDQLLIDLATVTTWTGSRSVNLSGGNAAPTAASASAITTLQGNGVTVVTN